MPPPADYYLDKLELLLDWVQRHHAGLLDAPVRRFLAEFRRLPVSARRLWTRLALRRGPRFRVDALVYGEVPDRARAVVALSLAGLVRLVSEPGPRLVLLRVPELAELCRAAGAGAPASAGRAALLARARDLLEAGRIAPEVLPAVVQRRGDDALAYLRLLFFANARQDLVEFVLEDLGTLRFARVDLAPRLPWRSAAEVRRTLALHAAADRLHALGAEPAAEGPERLLLELVLAPGARDAPTQGRRNRALLRLARLHEHAERPDAALRCLLRADGPPAREQGCRRLAALGDRKAAETLRRRMAQDPGDAAEAHFAARFAPDRGRCRPVRRGGAIAVERVELPGTLREAARVEALAAAHVALAGGRAYHLEGRLAGLVFMLACWDLVFAPLPGAFVQPFQAGPLDLFSPAFAERRRASLARRLEELASGRFGTDRALAHWDTHRGTVNALLPWQAFDRATAATLFDGLAPAHRAALCAHVAADPLRARRGFPDLTVLAADGCRFLEVKGPGDTLRPDQREWLAFLRRAGIPAGVLEVRFAA